MGKQNQKTVKDFRAYGHNPVILSHYLNEVVCSNRGEICRAATIMAKKLHREYHFGSIAVTGWSGALVGPEVASILELPLTIIRKEGESNHVQVQVEGAIGGYTYIQSKWHRALFVDDFMQTGETWRRCEKELARYKTEMVGVLLYLGSKPVGLSSDWLITRQDVGDHAILACMNPTHRRIRA